MSNEINNNSDFFLNFSEGQEITYKALNTLYQKFRGSNDLHLEKYGVSKNSDDGILETGEEFITVWKDEGNVEIDYKGNLKVSFVLTQQISTTGDEILIYKCIYLK